MIKASVLIWLLRIGWVLIAIAFAFEMTPQGRTIIGYELRSHFGGPPKHHEPPNSRLPLTMEYRPLPERGTPSNPRTSNRPHPTGGGAKAGIGSGSGVGPLRPNFAPQRDIFAPQRAMASQFPRTVREIDGKRFVCPRENAGDVNCIPLTEGPRVVVFPDGRALLCNQAETDCHPMSPLSK
jgi:hypothetical protein